MKKNERHILLFFVETTHDIEENPIDDIPPTESTESTNIETQISLDNQISILPDQESIDSESNQIPIDENKSSSNQDEPLPPTSKQTIDCFFCLSKIKSKFDVCRNSRRKRSRCTRQSF